MEKRFKIGDKVVALTGQINKTSQPRVKGKVYAIHAIQYCSGCGEQAINLGVQTPINGSDLSVCMCGKQSLNEGLHWTLSKFFAKVDDLESAMEEAVENEDYELAATLRDLNKDLV
jgi:excinuclease UvrABC helicase subunit UvrB